MAADRNLVTLCLDRHTGEKRWEQMGAAAEPEKVHRVNSPTIADHTLYVRPAGHLWAFRASVS